MEKESLPAYDNVSDVITKKIASLEVIKVHQIVKLQGYLNAGGILTILLAERFNVNLGMLLAVVLIIINGFLLMRAKNEVMRLEKTYNVKAEPAKVF